MRVRIGGGRAGKNRKRKNNGRGKLGQKERVERLSSENERNKKQKVDRE